MPEQTQEELLTTGQAAALLGSSRQHIVDLCDSGKLPYRKIAIHRRVRRDDVEAIAHGRASVGLRREELRSLWLNRAIAGQLARDPERVLQKARENLVRFMRIHASGRSGVWLKQWEALLDDGPEAVMRTLTSDAPQAIELRQNSPFPGVLSEVERRQVLDAFSDYWNTRGS